MLKQIKLSSYRSISLHWLFWKTRVNNNSVFLSLLLVYVFKTVISVRRCWQKIQLWVVAHDFNENIGSSCLKTSKLRYVISVAFCSAYSELNCIVENVSRELNLNKTAADDIKKNIYWTFDLSRCISTRTEEDLY